MAEIESLERAWFEQWRHSTDFESAVERATPDEADMRKQEFKFWREAWVAAQFVRRSSMRDVRIRLTLDSSPQGDFELEDHTGVSGFEVAEAIDPSMPPALKALRRAGGIIFQESEEAVSGSLARSIIPKLIAQKSHKNYPPGTGLVIYVNLWVDFERAGTAGLVPAMKCQFRTIWLLTLGTILQIFPQ